LPDWRLCEGAGGLYVLTALPRDLDEATLLTAAARQGVGVEGLSLHSYTGVGAPGLVLGHAHLAEPAIERDVRLLADAAGATAGA
jgi:GntR family transcriptional regulator / MocR family aminotransferase